MVNHQPEAQEDAQEILELTQWGITLLAQRALEWRKEKDALRAQMFNVGVTPYMDRMRQLAAERDEARLVARRIWAKLVDKVKDDTKRLMEKCFPWLLDKGV